MESDVKTLPDNPQALKKIALDSFKNIQSLASNNDELISENKKLLADIDQWKERYQRVLEQFKLAQQHRFSASSEKIKNDLQGELHFDEPGASLTEEEPAPEPGTTLVKAHERISHPKRKPLPAELPREVIEVDISDSEKTCECGCEKNRIGECISEQLDMIPMQLKVIQHVRPKYACKACESGVSIAPMPPLLLPKSIASAGLVAHTITAKYTDHLPLYRQEVIWRRHGIDIPRNSSCDWLMKTADQCESIYALIQTHVLSQDIIQADETTVQVLNEPERRDNQKSYMWVYRGGGEKCAVYFEYQETRQGKHPHALLGNFKGYLQTDGYKGYDWVKKKTEIIHLGCMAHARRPFAKLVKLTKTVGTAHELLGQIEKLYAIEKDARKQHYTPDQRYELRLKEAVPILSKIKKILDKTIQRSAPSGLLGKGIQYMLDRWGELNHYLKDGRLEIDNNLIENDIRLFALGRKNWLFAGSPRGARAGAIFYSLIKTAQANGLEPYQYLRDMLNRIAACKTTEDYKALLPWNINSDKIANQ